MYNLGKYDDSVKAYEKSLEIDNEDPLVHNNLGLSFACKGEFEKAIDCFN